MTVLQTHLQTVPTLDPLSAGSVAQRAGSGGVNAVSAPRFAGVLDAFTQVESDDAVGQAKEAESSVDSEVEESGDDAEHLGTGESIPVEGDEGAAEDGEQIEQESRIAEGKRVGVENSQRINTAEDLARLLSNAARIDLAGLATGELGGAIGGQFGGEAVVQDAGVKSGVEQQGDAKQSDLNQKSMNERPLDIGARQPGGQNLSEIQGSATGGVQLKQTESVVQPHTPVDVKVPMASERPPVVQVSDVQVWQSAQSQRADLSSNARRLNGLGSISEFAAIEGKSSRVVSGSEPGGKAGADSGGLDLGNRSKEAGRILQGKPDADKAMERQQIMNQVQRGLASIMNTKGGSMKIRLSPEHLGEVNIQLTTKGGHVSVKIDAENAETRSMLKDGLEGLRGAMESRGVQVDELSMGGRQPTEFERLFGDADRGGGQRRREDEHQSGGREESFAGEDELNGDEPRGIWTEFGLDAIA